jgi:hypothetical protein
VLGRKRKRGYAVLLSEHEGPPTAFVEFFPHLDNPAGATLISWVGDEAILQHLPSCYFDKVLTIVRPRDEAESLVRVFRSFVEETRADGRKSGDERFPPLLNAQPDADPTATVEVEVVGNFDRERLGAITRFNPRKWQEAVAQRVLFDIFDWTIDQTAEVAGDVMDDLLLQCEVYRVRGIPRLRDLGKAPFLATMKNASDRLADELGAMVGISGAEFRELPREHQDQIIDEHTRRLHERDMEAE